MADDVILFDKLTVSFRDRGEAVEVGSVINGVFFAWGTFKKGGFLEDLAEGQAAEAAAKSNGAKK